MLHCGKGAINWVSYHGISISSQFALETELPPKNLTIVDPAGRRPSYPNSSFHHCAVEDVLSVPTRVHPSLDNRLGIRIAEGNVFGQAAVAVADVPRAIAQRWQARVGNGVRHFLEPR